MPSFKHRRTGRIIETSDQDAFRFRNSRYEEIHDNEAIVAAPFQWEVPEGNIAEVLAWAGDDLAKRRTALKAEKAGKKRKGVIEALS